MAKADIDRSLLIGTLRATLITITMLDGCALDINGREGDDGWKLAFSKLKITCPHGEEIALWNYDSTKPTNTTNTRNRKLQLG